MSLNDVRLLVADLPRALGEQVIGYAESVDRALPEIFREARRRKNQQVVDQLVFIAAVKKIHWLASSSYWTLENSGKLLASMNVTRVRVGQSDLSRGGIVYEQLQSLLNDLETVLEQQQAGDYLRMSWSELVRAIVSDERR